MTKYINTRYCPNLDKDIPVYVNHNGVFKKSVLFLIKRSNSFKDKIFYNFEDLPDELQKLLEDMAISDEEIVQSRISSDEKYQYYYDSDGIKVIINERTPIIPVVDNFLPNDDINAFTVKIKDGTAYLSPIIVGISWHWSELYTGNTKYGNNVFCLLSDISNKFEKSGDIESLNRFLDKAILLKDAPEYLNNLEKQESKESNFNF